MCSTHKHTHTHSENDFFFAGIFANLNHFLRPFFAHWKTKMKIKAKIKFKHEEKWFIDREKVLKHECGQSFQNASITLTIAKNEDYQWIAGFFALIYSYRSKRQFWVFQTISSFVLVNCIFDCPEWIQNSNIYEKTINKLALSRAWTCSMYFRIWVEIMMKFLNFWPQRESSKTQLLLFGSMLIEFHSNDVILMKNTDDFHFVFPFDHNEVR